MAVIKVTDEAHQFRIDIEGRLNGEQVSEVRSYWQTALNAVSWRKFTVDISQLTGYDRAGSQLLREMHTHGAYVAARTASALVFLREISNPEVSGPTLVYQAKNRPRRKSPRRALAPLLTRAAASGE